MDSILKYTFSKYCSLEYHDLKLIQLNFFLIEVMNFKVILRLLRLCEFIIPLAGWEV